MDDGLHAAAGVRTIDVLLYCDMTCGLREVLTGTVTRLAVALGLQNAHGVAVVFVTVLHLVK